MNWRHSVNMMNSRLEGLEALSKLQTLDLLEMGDMMEILDTLETFDIPVTLNTNLFWAVLQKSVLHLEWSPKQCKGAFIRSFCSLAIANDPCFSLL